MSVKGNEASAFELWPWQFRLQRSSAASSPKLAGGFGKVLTQELKIGVKQKIWRPKNYTI